MHLIALLVAPLLLGHQGKVIRKDVVIGSGPAAKTGDMLVVDYKGTLLNGKVFDQSFGKAPLSFIIGNGVLIKGWEQGVVGMKVGGKRKLTIPPSLGWGSRDMGDIPPNSTVKFDIKLYHIWPKATRKKLIVKTLTPGKGRAAKAGDTVLVNFKGMFPNGVEFDRTRGTPYPVKIGAGGVIPGLEQGLVGMKVGERRKIIVHPDLGYGAQGAGGGTIPANATLVFELELVRFQ